MDSSSSSSGTECAVVEKALELRPQPWMAVSALCRREIVRFFRQKNRIIGAIGQPLLFWLLFGAGLNRSFQLSDSQEMNQSFSEYYFPGSLVLILLFTAIFTTISIIEDRREGFLQSVLVAPIPRWSMVLGKVLGGSLIAMLQGMVFLLLAFTLDIEFQLWRFLGLVVLMFITSVALTSLGFVIAWRMDSTQGFHAIMSLVLMPMWLLSGSFFPIPAADAASSWSSLAMHWVMRLNPLSYCVAGVRGLLNQGELPQEFWAPSLGTAWLVTLIFTAVIFAAAWKTAAHRTTGDLL